MEMGKLSKNSRLGTQTYFIQLYNLKYSKQKSCKVLNAFKCILYMCIHTCHLSLQSVC